MMDQNTPQNQQADEDLKKDLEAAQQKINELTEMSKRALADLANYKKRIEQEKAAFSQFANLALILEILPVLDNLQRAAAHIPESAKNEEWVKGFLQIEKQFSDIVKKQGLTPMENSAGQSLDPHRHEAVTNGPGEKDIILEEFEKGYLLNDKIIRPAKVKVGDGSVDTVSNM